MLPVAYNRIRNAKTIANPTPLMAFSTKASSVAILGQSAHVYFMEYLISLGALPFWSSTNLAHFSYSIALFSPVSLLLKVDLAVILVKMISSSLIPKYLLFYLDDPLASSSSIQVLRCFMKRAFDLTGNFSSSSSSTYFSNSFIQQVDES